MTHNTIHHLCIGRIYCSKIINKKDPRIWHVVKRIPHVLIVHELWSGKHLSYLVSRLDASYDPIVVLVENKKLIVILLIWLYFCNMIGGGTYRWHWTNNYMHKTKNIKCMKFWVYDLPLNQFKSRRWRMFNQLIFQKKRQKMMNNFTMKV